MVFFLIIGITSRNKKIFRGVVTAAKPLWAEVLSTRGMHNISKEPLTAEERVWVSKSLVLPPHLPWIQPKKNSILQSRKIRMNSEEFKSWWKKLGCSYLFFHEASKGNSGMEGVGESTSTLKETS